ncbi:hypothetical protein [Halobacteriovorax sp. JY17]|uniref:hypothetical protein n=1 Tax=Halobacteriovorax sp. JY17 TaxID=2014617 RepID=UPI000C5D76C7|nr:hypothetical protein [Halobacteriovorax sp. JY17]PIK16289.1 MAG: hypothetical protein CES88_06000 [Halobacteriovorax sp. JY17]
MKSNSTMINALLKRETLVMALMLFSLTSINALAVESSLITITNDETPTIFKMVIDTDENSDIKKFYKDTYDNKVRVSRELIPLNKIIDGVNLEKRDKYEIVNLKSDNFAAHNGGNLELDTLYNGAKGTRKSYELEIDRVGDNWEVLKDGKKVHVLHLKSNKVFLLGTVGIKDIEVKK